MLDGLYALREEKAVELQFTVGEGLVCALAGRHCTAANDRWDPHNPLSVEEDEHKDDR